MMSGGYPVFKWYTARTAQTITFGALAAKNYGDAAFTLTP